MACDRFFLSRIQGLSFFKSLGTGTGEKFTPSDADPTMWGLIAVVEDISLIQSSSLFQNVPLFPDAPIQQRVDLLLLGSTRSCS